MAKDLTPILRAINFKNNIFLKNDGFTIIEILIVLFLITLIFFAIPFGTTNTETTAMESAVDAFDRAIRFASQEAVLRNSVVRLKIDMDKIPVEYVVEYGPKDAFVLPEFTDASVASLDDIDKNKKKASDLDSKFAKVPEFNDINKEIHEYVKILGIATSARNSLIKTGAPAIYFYPSGERDSALIIFATSVEVAGMDIQAYNDKVNTTFKNIDVTNSNADPEDLKEKLADSVYKDWIKPN
ncbi:MAG: pilus assembly FimT family protein [Bacteriovoracaceae bacterium]